VAIAPDGSFVVAWNNVMRRFDANGSPLTDQLNNSDPDWSPDGQWIAYTTARGGSTHIFLMMITGGEKTRLTDDSSNDMYPAWQPIPA